eukprot:1976654-Pleurochrysis_carterae.AAC.1
MAMVTMMMVMMMMVMTTEMVMLIGLTHLRGARLLSAPALGVHQLHRGVEYRQLGLTSQQFNLRTKSGGGPACLHAPRVLVA